MKRTLLYITSLIASTIFAQNSGDYLFLSPMIHTVKIYFTQPAWYDSLIVYKPLDQKMLGSVEIDGFWVNSVGVQLKGNSSFNVPGKKKSWKIDFNEFVSGQKFDGIKAINLNNGFKDPTFLREKIALDYCYKNNIPAPRCSYANVYVNDTLWGFYVMVEQVDKTFLNNWFPENSGNLFKGDPQGTLAWLGNLPSAYYTKYELKTNELANDWSDLIHLIDKINNTPTAQFYDSLESALNTSAAINTWAFNILFTNLDSYQGSGHNYYVYHNLVSNKFEMIVWDVNESFGNFNMGMTINQLENLSIFFIPNPANSRPLVNKMLQNNTYKSNYISRLCNFISNDFDTNYLYRKIDSLVPIIRPYVYADTQKFYSNTHFETNLNSNITVGSFAIPGLKSFILNRKNSLVSQLAANGCVLGITDINSISHFQIFPNPSLNIIYLNIPTRFSISQLRLNIYDMTGKLVKSDIIDNTTPLDKYAIYIEDIDVGIYLCKIVSDDKVFYQDKLIIIR